MNTNLCLFSRVSMFVSGVPRMPAGTASAFFKIRYNKGNIVIPFIFCAENKELRPDLFVV